MRNAISSEWYLLRARRVPMVIGILWAVLVALFGIGIPYIVYLALPADSEQDTGALLEAVVLPSSATTALGSYPLFGGAIMLILGVLVTGPEFRWGTWTARFTQGPGRGAVIGAKALVGAAVASLVTVGALVAAMAASAVITAVEGRPLELPTAGELGGALVGAALVSSVWTTIGMSLALLLRGTTTALIAGLLWALAFENIISGLVQVLTILEPVRAALPGVAAGSLVAALGAPTQDSGGSPGVVAVLDAPAALLVMALYVAVALGAAVLVTRRRDIA